MTLKDFSTEQLEFIKSRFTSIWKFVEPEVTFENSPQEVELKLIEK